MNSKFFTALVLALGAHSAQAVTVNEILFTDVPVGAQVDNYFQSEGVIFSSHGASDNTRNPVFTADPNFKLDGFGVTDFARTINGRESFNIRVDFLLDIESVSAEVTSANGHALTMKAYNEFNTQIASRASAVGNLGDFETLTIEDPDIAYVIFASSLPYASSPVIDSLTFGAVVIPDPDPVPDPVPNDPPATVPVPASLPLLIGGLLWLAGLRGRSLRKT